MDADYKLMTGNEVVAWFADDDPTDICYAWNAMHYYQGQSEYAVIFADCDDLTALENVIGGDWLWQWASDYDRLKTSLSK